MRNLAVIFLCVFCAGTLSALQIEPLRTMIQVDAAQKTRGSITLTNSENQTIRISVSLQNPFLEKAESENHQWIKLDKEILTIEPREQSILNYEVFIPEGITGECSSRIAFTRIPAEDSSGKGMVSINTKVSVPFFATVKGTQVCNFEVKMFKVDNRPATKAEVTISNLGNTHVRPTGTCTIKVFDSDEIVQLADFNHSSYPVFPDKEHTFTIQFEKPLPVGKYTAGFDLESSNYCDFKHQQTIPFEIYEEAVIQRLNKIEN